MQVKVYSDNIAMLNARSTSRHTNSNKLSQEINAK